MKQELDRIELFADKAMKFANQAIRRQIVIERELTGFTTEDFGKLADVLKQFGQSELESMNGCEPYLRFTMNDAGATFIANGGFEERRKEQSYSEDSNKIAKRSNIISIIALIIAFVSLVFTVFINVFM